MRLIDADALIKDLETVNPVYNAKIAWAKSIIDAAPTIDAVEVVRCKDCKWAHDKTFHKKSNEYIYVCMRSGMTAPETAFCNFGEHRKD